MENYFDIKFTYLPTLCFTTVQSNLVGGTINGISGDIMSSATILNSLFGNDCGDKSPNPKTQYQLNELRIDYDKFKLALDEKNYGKPYMWAQKLCGFDFNKNSPGSSLDLKTEICVKSLPETVQALKLRWESREMLQKQIHSFEENNIDFVSSLSIHSSVRLSSNLVQCTAITWTEYKNQIKLKNDIEDDNIINENDLFYRIVLTRGSGKFKKF